MAATVHDVSATFRIRDVMTTDLVTLSEGESMNLASTIMQVGRIRHLPVVNDEHQLTGLVTHRDLLRVSVSDVADLSSDERKQLLEAIPVREVMQKHIVTTHPMCSLLDAAQLLINHKYGCLPVVDELGKLVGLVTEHDFVRMMITLLEASQEQSVSADNSAPCPA